MHNVLIPLTAVALTMAFLAIITGAIVDHLSTLTAL